MAPTAEDEHSVDDSRFCRREHGNMRRICGIRSQATRSERDLLEEGDWPWDS
jgi:hypothetical protein